MSVMEQHDLVSWTMAHPAAATALATMALVAVGLLVGLGQIGAIIYGIRKMGEGNRARTEQHREAMDTEANRHKEAMEAHRETMQGLAVEHADSRRRHEQSMKALNALIRNTGHRNRPIPVR